MIGRRRSFDQSSADVDLGAGFFQAELDCAPRRLERCVEFVAGIAIGDFYDDRRGAFDRALVGMTRDHFQASAASPHGFRASFRSWATAKKISSEVAERCLAHERKDATQAAYDREEMLEHRREVMEQSPTACLL